MTVRTRTQPVTLRIFDKEYVIACPAEQRESLQASAAYLTKKMQEVREGGKIVSTERIAVMTALNIVHELMHQRQADILPAQSNLTPELKRLETKINQALESLPADI